MKLIAFPKYSVEFALPVATLQLLQRCAERHYDQRCREAGSPRGVITKWIAITENMNIADVEPRISGEFSDFDTCLKIMEMTFHLTEVEQCEIGMIVLLFRRILEKINKLHVRGVVEWESDVP